MLIGYARVSTEDQNLDLQRDALPQSRMQEDFRGEGVGARRHQAPGVRGRPRLNRAPPPLLRPEDQLAVWEVDRLGRSLREMLDTAHMLQTRAIKLRSLTEQVDTETATGRLMFNFLGHRRVLSRPQPRADHGGPESGSRSRPQGRL